MILGALLLLFPVPQTVNIAKLAAEPSVVISDSTTKESSTSTAPTTSASNSSALPSAPEAKVKTDAELAAEPAPAFQPGEPIKPAAHRQYETPRQKKVWFALMAAGHAGAAFDAWSTRRAVSGGFGTEANPFLRPFAHSNALYAATQVSPAVMDFLGKRMMTSRHEWIRRMWWLPQAAGTTVSFTAGAHNVGLVH